MGTYWPPAATTAWIATTISMLRSMPPLTAASVPIPADQPAGIHTDPGRELGGDTRVPRTTGQPHPDCFAAGQRARGRDPWIVTGAACRDSRATCFGIVCGQPVDVADGCGRLRGQPLEHPDEGSGERVDRRRVEQVDRVDVPPSGRPSGEETTTDRSSCAGISGSGRVAIDSPVSDISASAAEAPDRRGEHHLRQRGENASDRTPDRPPLTTDSNGTSAWVNPARSTLRI